MCVDFSHLCKVSNHYSTNFMLNMFRLRQIFNVGASRLSPKVKSMSTNSDSFLNVSVHKDGIAVIKIQRPPVNGINLELLQQIFDSLKELENDRCKGIILSSVSNF